MFTNRTLLITGSTGSFANAVLRQFLHTDSKEIRIFSRDEKKQDDMRQSMKRPEAQDEGTIILTGFNPQVVRNSIQVLVEEFEMTHGYKRIADDYSIDNK